jgi:hypothetical protein
MLFTTYAHRFLILHGKLGDYQCLRPLSRRLRHESTSQAMSSVGLQKSKLRFLRFQLQLNVVSHDKSQKFIVHVGLPHRDPSSASRSGCSSPGVAAQRAAGDLDSRTMGVAPMVRAVSSSCDTAARSAFSQVQWRSCVWIGSSVLSLR